MIPKYEDQLFRDSKEEAERDTAKSRALANMEWVYKGASKVLVLDRGLLSLSTVSMKAEEIGAHLMMSVWSKRLWTYQEGCSKDRTVFQFRDRALSWPSLHEEVRKKSSLTSWASSISAFPESHPVRKSQRLDVVQINVGYFRGTHPPAFMPGSPRAFALAGVDKVDKRLYRVINQVWHSVHTFLEDMTIDFSWYDFDMTGKMKSGALIRTMRGMYYRNLTEPGDESLVLASLLSRGAGSTARLREESPNPEERFRTLFKKLDYIPRDLLFADQARYTEYGCRWIPKSLLAVNTSQRRLIERTRGTERAYAVGALNGMYVIGALFMGLFPSGLIEGALVLSLTAALSIRRMRKKSPMCAQEEHGIATTLAGLRIYPRPTLLKSPFAFEITERGSRPFSKPRTTGWKVVLREPGTGNEVTALPKAEWCLLVDEYFQKSLETASVAFDGLLVEVKEWYKTQPGGLTKFHALARLVPVDQGDEEWNGLPRVEVQLTSRASHMITPDKWVVG